MRKTLTRAPASTGCRSTNHEPATATASSVSDSATFENGSGLVLAIRRTPAFVAGVGSATPAATSQAATSMAGSGVPSADGRINAAASGRTNVWIASQAVSSQGILSAKNSTAYSAPATTSTSG